MKTTYSYLAKRVTVPVIIVWLLAMILLTVAVAQDFAVQLELGAMNQLQASGNLHADEGIPGSVENTMLRNLGFTYLQLDTDFLFPFLLLQTPDNISSDDWYWGKWELVYGFQAATAYYDSQGKPLFYSGDWLSFLYETKDGSERYGYIDLNTLEGGSELADRYISRFVTGDPSPFLMGTVKLTGWMDGNRMDVVRIHASSGGGPMEMVYERDYETVKGLSYIYADASRYFDRVDVWGLNYVPGSAFTADGQRFDSVVDVLLTPGYHAQNSIFNTLIHRSQKFSLNGEEYTVSVAVQCYPLKYAATRLAHTYLITFNLLLLCLSFIHKGIRKNLTEPLQVINRAYVHNRRELSEYADSPLAELKELGSHFNQRQGQLHDSLQENQQLQTALDYARGAEENRRKLVSDLAHELKTPLAVIHSYAEGLRDGIAGDQTDRYLHVIEEETERMDALVLQMLDLSRLEAGKVKLRSDRFSLSELTERVLQKQALAIESKKLQVAYVLKEKRTIVADEGRIEQVITNLVTNAVKYTPEEGSIRIKTFSHGNSIRFLIENTCPPLAPEVLEKLWDSFYRADASRNSEGTGLGLAIVKSILRLHRGSCSVRNTKEGVEFSFSLPL